MQDIIREEGGSHFTIQAIMKEFKKKLLLVIAIVLLCAAIGGVYGGVVVDTKYTTTSNMIVNVGNTGTLEQSQNLATALKSITEPANDTIYELTAMEFINKYHYYDMKREDLKNEIKRSITVTADSMLLNFTMTTSISEAKAILNIFMNKVIDFVNSPKIDEEGNLLDEDGNVITDPDADPVPQYPLFADKVFIVSPATEPTNDADTKVFKNMAIFFLIGMVISVLIVVIKVLLNNTYADKVSFEDDYEIDVLATFEDIRCLADEIPGLLEEDA